jgi:queuosine precursor transporter
MPAQVKRMHTLYQWICASFCVIVVLSNILSAKMVSLPWLAIQVPAGLITYPLTFLLSDLITEIFGARRAKLMVYIAFAMSLLSFAMIQFCLWLPTEQLEQQRALQSVLGLSGLRIFASLFSYLISQIVDIQLYAAIKRWTGSRFLWLRNNGSTCASQMVDTVIIDLVFLWWGLGMPIFEVFGIILFSYSYKALFSVACTPLFYLLVYLIRGKWERRKLKGHQVAAR